LWEPFVFLALLGLVVVSLAILRFRRYLAPAPSSRRLRRRHRAEPGRRADGGANGAADVSAGEVVVAQDVGTRGVGAQDVRARGVGAQDVGAQDVAARDFPSHGQGQPA
jgi:hypothetical protein